MELSDYLRILRAHWRGVVALVLLAIAAAAIYNLTQPRVYAADATGFVSADQGSNAALGSVADTLAKSRAKSYVDIAQSRPVAETVINELGLDEPPSSLIGRVSVEQPLDTVLLKVTAQASTPQAARDMANAWVAALAGEVDKIENPRGRPNPPLAVVPYESAALPTSPVLPRTERNLALGFVLGALLGLAYAVLRSQLDRRIRSATAVEKQFGIPVAGAIPATSDLARSDDGRTPLVVGARSARLRPSDSAEAFRKLRTNLQFMDVDNPPRVIVVTSPHQGDGKSTIAANLAVSLAANGQPTTLLDGDLRRPTVAESFGLVEGAGLTDVLVGRVDLDDVLQSRADQPDLQVLAAGDTPPNPSELLGSQAMRRTLKELTERGMVIVDAPPLLPVTDAAVLTAIADGAFVVVASGKTLDSDLGAALGHLEAVRGRALGVVINRVKRGDAYGGYYGGYYQSRSSEPKTRTAAETEQTVS